MVISADNSFLAHKLYGKYFHTRTMKRYILRQGLKLLQLHGHSISKYNLPELIFSRDAIFQDLCII